MRSSALALGALVISVSASAQSSNDSTIVTSMDAGDIRAFVQRAGHRIAGNVDSGIGVVGEDSAGTRFVVQGKACGDDQSCKGLMMYLIVDGAGTADYANEVNSRWSAIKATALDSGNLLLSRYVILDHGQTLRNLELNLGTTRSIARSVKDDRSASFNSLISGRTSASSISWGDDSGSYANDGACDDGRFHEDGDTWTYQRQHVLRDATDCRTNYEAGNITLHLDFGDNSGRYANDGTCDDNRFTGSGRSILTTDSHVRRDAQDCIAAYRAETINR